jgi:exosortase/archaeosortase family protein
MRWHQSRAVSFLWKALLIYIIWYVVYELWLLPKGTIDQWLTTHIVVVSSNVLEFLKIPHFAEGRLIGMPATAGVLLVNGCSGISAMGLFVGFVIAYPGRWDYRLMFILFGVFILYLVNIIRITVLVVVQGFWDAGFAIMHDYSTSAVFYLVIFLLWMIWANLNQYLPPAREKEPNPAVK